MLYTGFLHDGVSAVRYPRGTGPRSAGPARDAGDADRQGRGAAPGRGGRVPVVSGPLLHHVMEVAEPLDCDTVFNMRFVKPLDEDAVLSLASDHELLVTVEENAIGGAGGAVSECLRGQRRSGAACCRSDFRIGSFSMEAAATCLRKRGLDAAGIARSVDEFLARHGGGRRPGAREPRNAPPPGLTRPAPRLRST